MFTETADATSPKNTKLEQMRSRLRPSLFSGQSISPVVTANKNIEFVTLSQKIQPKSEATTPKHETANFPSSDMTLIQTRARIMSLFEPQKNQSSSAFRFAEYTQSLLNDSQSTDNTLTENFDSKTLFIQEIEDQGVTDKWDSEQASPNIMLTCTEEALPEKIQEELKEISLEKNSRIPEQEIATIEDEKLEDVTPSVHTIFQRFFAVEEEKFGSPEEHIHKIFRTFEDHFQELEILGEGTSGTVKRCIRILDRKEYAVKIVSYRGDEELRSLIVAAFKNLRRIRHKNVVEVLDLYIDESRSKIYTVMELVKGKEMFEKIQESGSYSESDARIIFKQILFAIQYLHLNGVCHRDLKPNNILVSEDGKTVKVTDFNISKFSDENLKSRYTGLSNENYKMWTYTGTVAFIAPEVFNETEYTEVVDMWSVGVVLYTMLCGYQPFQAEYMHDLIDLIKKGNFDFEGPVWDNVSNEAKDLVTRLLNKNYKKRYTPVQALGHPWIQKAEKTPDKKLSTTLQNLKSNLKKNAKRSYLSGRIPGENPTKVESLPHLGSLSVLDMSNVKIRSNTVLYLEDAENGTIILD